MRQEFDILFVGAGPASLASALHLKRALNKLPRFKDLKVVVIEKAPNVGDHCLSGASFDPKALAELVPDYQKYMGVLGPKVSGESLNYLTEKSRIPFPIVPPQMSNHDCYILSLAEFTRWLAGLCEKEGVEIYTGEPADDLIMDERGAVKGVVIREKGRDKEGGKKANYLEPTEVTAKITILGEGARGHLTKRLIKRLSLDKDRTAQGHAIGLKEIWQIKEDLFKPGYVMHTMGWPLGLSTFGGSFMYHHKDSHMALGLVVSLDYKNPYLHPFELFQQWKMHPSVAHYLKDARLVAYGAKTLSEGGWYCVPKLYGHGFMIIGESAGFLNPMRLKGIHLSMKSGMLAAETIVEALERGDYSEASLKGYEDRVNNSWIKKEMYRSRNFHQGYHHGVISGMINTGLQIISGGRGLIDKFKTQEDWCTMKKLLQICCKPKEFTPDGKISFDKLTSVFSSGTKHEEDQPCHLKIDDISICNGKCKEEYGNPCTRFCPAHVYEMVEDENGKKVLELSPTNCLHCKTCDVKDPYNIVNWVPPEGGGGPNYKGM